jgi:hypothetical protein
MQTPSRNRQATLERVMILPALLWIVVAGMCVFVVNTWIGN